MKDAGERSALPWSIVQGSGWARAIVAACVLTVAVGAGPLAGAQGTTPQPDSSTSTTVVGSRRATLDAEAADADRTVRLAIAGLIAAAAVSGVLTWRFVLYTDPAKGYVRSRVRRSAKSPGPR
ncbi:MAG: hypothetical protein FJW83_11725 [Actinobacteria bacterium]|nr:hypothetical protein [Actinomycetota bacterium]